MATGVETVAREAGQRCGPRLPASRRWRRRLATTADLGRLRRNPGEGGRGRSWPPASRLWRGRRATAAYLGRRRRDRGEGGGPHPRSRPPASRPRRGRPRQILATGVETVAREAGQRCGPRPPASRPRRGRRATAAYLGRRRRDRGEGGGPHPRSRPPASRPLRGQRCEDFLDAKTRRSGSDNFRRFIICERIAYWQSEKSWLYRLDCVMENFQHMMMLDRFC